MRHPTQPPDHSRLTATVIGGLIAFACLIGAKTWGEHDDAMLRLSMLPIYAKVNR